MLIVVALLLAVAVVAQAEEVPKRYEANWESLDTRPAPQWFLDAKFGIFIVWGPYSVPAYVDRGYSEWYRFQMENKASATWKYHERNYGPDFKYEQFADMFTADLWDPDFWADMIVKSGARYVVTTANYHDGFCLYPSKYSATNHTNKWNSMVVGPKRDLLGELNEAGRKRGLKMGIYYSLYEWFHPLWLEDRDRYVVEKFHPQFKEVVTRYRPPIIFLDGEWEMDDKKWRSEELAAWLFNDSPVADYVAINDRWGASRGKHGTFYESEYGGGNLPPTHPWQEDRGIGHSYGYNRFENIYDYDSAEELIRMLSKVVGNGGNYLLDIGPTADGLIPVIMQQRMLEIGQWLQVNGQAIYGSKHNPFWPRKCRWGTCTYKPGKLYLHVYGRPGDRITLTGMESKIAAAYFLADEKKRPLELTHKDSIITLALPEHMPDPYVSIIVIEHKGDLKINPDALDPPILQQDDGSVVLKAIDAAIFGSSPRYEQTGVKDQIGFWDNPKDSVGWTFKVKRSGWFDVQITYSSAAGAGGSAFDVSIGEHKMTGRTEETGSWDTYATGSLGRVKLTRDRLYKVKVQPRSTPPWHSMGLKSIVLKPD